MVSRVFLICRLALVLFPVALPAETVLSLIGGRNAGEHNLEAGSRMPGLLSEDGRGRGSRISYRRDFSYGGLSLTHSAGAWRAGLAFTATGWYVDSGGTRDEDFYMTIASGLREGGYNPFTNEFSDSAHIYTGTANFADARARSTITDYAIDLPLRYYLWPRLSDTNRVSGFFLAGGLRYNYFKLFVYDVIQFVDREPIFLGPIGEGLTFSNSVLEARGGLGYAHGFGGGWELDGALYSLSGSNRARDHHIQRGLNFIIFESYGSGFLANLGLSYSFTGGLRLQAQVYAHRYYSRGLMRTTGGYTDTDILSTFSGPFTVWVGTKEAGGSLSLAYGF